MMNEENKMDDVTPTTVRSESAFSGISNETEAIPTTVAPEIANPSLPPLTGPEIRILRPSKYMRSLAFLIPNSIIPRHKKSDILEVKFESYTEARTCNVLYTRQNPRSERAYLDLRQINPSPWERHLVGPVVVYPPSRFVNDYNKSKPVGLENTSLRFGEGRFTFSVDDKELAVANPTFRTYQGMVILDASIKDAGWVKIQKKLDGFEMRLRDHSRVLSMEMIGPDLLTTYARTTSDHGHRRMLAAVAPADHVKPVVQELVFRGKFRILSRQLGSVDVFTLEGDLEALEYVEQQLRATQTIDRFRKVKGDLAEKIFEQITRPLGLGFLADHPHNKDRWRVGSARTGPDFLVNSLASDEWLYVEVKWWNDDEDALETANEQALNDLDKYPECFGRKVDGSIIAVLDWKDGKPIRFMVARADRKQRR